MRTRSFTVSDLSGDLIQHDEDVVKLVVHGHPSTSGPVQLYVSTAEVGKLDAGEQDYVTLELVAQGGAEQRLVMKQAAFDAVFGDGVDDLLRSADP